MLRAIPELEAVEGYEKNGRDASLKFAVLGVGGGLLIRYLLEKYPTASVVGVELDPEMVEIAQKYFGLPDTMAQQSQRLRIMVEDALDFIRRIAESPSGWADFRMSYRKVRFSY